MLGKTKQRQVTAHTIWPICAESAVKPQPTLPT